MSGHGFSSPSKQLSCIRGGVGGGCSEAGPQVKKSHRKEGATIMCLGRMILGPPHPIPFPLWPSSLIPGLAGVGSRTRARARPQGHQDWQWGQWKEGQGWQSRTESRELNCRRQVACGDKERVSLVCCCDPTPQSHSWYIYMNDGYMYSNPNPILFSC